MQIRTRMVINPFTGKSPERRFPKVKIARMVGHVRHPGAQPDELPPEFPDEVDL